MNAKYISVNNLELLQAYYRNPSLKLRNKLVQANAGLVHKVACELRNQCSEPLEDLQQIGYMGLIRAIERFNPTQKTAFSSFAIPYIRGEILHYLRDRSGVIRIPRRWQELYKKGKKVRKQLINELGRLPKDTEVARALGVSISDWNECQVAVKNRMLMSLDVKVSQAAEDSATFGEVLIDPRYQVKQKLHEDSLELQGAIEQLEEKTKSVIEFVFLQDLSRNEAAKRMGMSTITITRHMRKGIEQLESLLQPQAA